MAARRNALTLTLEVALCPTCMATSPQYHGLSLSLFDSNHNSKWKDTAGSAATPSSGDTYGSNESKETGNGLMYWKRLVASIWQVTATR